MTLAGCKQEPVASRAPERKIRVLVVDDSPLARKMITDALESAEDIEVAGFAGNGYSAAQQVVSIKPDVLTLDIEMPGMDGITFLKRAEGELNVPAVVVSAMAVSGCRIAIDALRAGAVEVIGKPTAKSQLSDFRTVLPAKVRAAFASRHHGRPRVPEAEEPLHPLPRLRTPELIAIGSSTGGTEAVEAILRRMPPDCPGIVIAQHIPARFSLMFAERLMQVCDIEVKEAAAGDRIIPGRALIAPGDQHMTVQCYKGEFEAAINQGPRVGFQRPSVDMLFRSVAIAAPRALGVILTGMGNDGTAGMLEMKRAGAQTLAQDEASCAVFGMPKEAIRAGAVDYVLSLRQIAAALARLHVPQVSGRL